MAWKHRFALALVLAALPPVAFCSAAPLAVQQGESIVPRQDYFELRGGLTRARHVFERTGRGRVAFLGGSITHNPGWRDQVCAYLRERFPNTSFDFIAAGIPSTGSTPGAFRLERDVFAGGPVDLLFEEAAVNDSSNGRSSTEQVRAMEGIVRRASTLNPRVDVILMHFVDPDKMRVYGEGSVPPVIRNHERVATHYDIPSLNLALEVTERIARGEFTWKDDFRNLHPSPFGQDLYASSIRRTLEAAWPQAVEIVEGAEEPPPRALPEPLDPFCYDRGRLLPPTAVTSRGEFRLVERWSNDVGGGTRPGFVDVPMLVGERPGDSFELEFRGSAVGLFIAAGPDAGVIEFRIDGGPWRERDLFTRWSARLHLPRLHVFDAELDDDATHKLEVRITATHNEKSTGHACRVVNFAINGD